MEIKEKITLDMLNEESVSVKREKYIIIDGSQMPVGTVERNAYTNSAVGRELLSKQLPAEYCSAVFAVWGSTPLCSDSQFEQ